MSRKLKVVQDEAELFVRPSSLQMAEVCERSPWLSARYQERNPATEHGSNVDAEVSVELMGRGAATSPQAIALVAWVRSRFPADARFLPQHRVTLNDPVTGKRITTGTPDLLVVIGRKVYVVDWKTKGQMFAGHLKRPDDNLQQLTYLVAAGMEFDAEEAQIILACFDDRGIEALESEVYPAESWWPIIDHIKAIPPIDLNGPEPTATKGDHCSACYQRIHCSAYLMPAMDNVPVALVPFTGEGTDLTTDTALAALDWLDMADEAIKRAKQVRDAVEAQLETYATIHGPLRKDGKEWGPVPSNGKRSGPTVSELEEMGLTNLIKPGKPGVRFDWRKLPKQVSK